MRPFPWTCLLLLSCTDQASPDPQPPVPPPSRLMTVLDQDGDGQLSEAEFKRVAHPSRRFEDHDRDGNHQLDTDELRAMLLEVSPLLPDYRGQGNDGKNPTADKKGQQPQAPGPAPPAAVDP